MTEHELEGQCMALSHLIDTEVVTNDPRKIPSFDANTLYVWLVPWPENDVYRDHPENQVRGRLGKRDETAESVSVGVPEPPNRLAFTCPCGADLIATPEIYDKHSRCGMCQTVILINLVYDAEHRSHEIVAFRVNPS